MVEKSVKVERLKNRWNSVNKAIWAINERLALGRMPVLTLLKERMALYQKLEKIEKELAKLEQE